MRANQVVSHKGKQHGMVLQLLAKPDGLVAEEVQELADAIAEGWTVTSSTPFIVNGLYTFVVFTLTKNG